MREFISKLISKLKTIELTNDQKFAAAFNVSGVMLIAFVAVVNESLWVFGGGVWLLAAVDVLAYGMIKLNINT